MLYRFNVLHTKLTSKSPNAKQQGCGVITYEEGVFSLFFFDNAEHMEQSRLYPALYTQTRDDVEGGSFDDVNSVGVGEVVRAL